MISSGKRGDYLWLSIDNPGAFLNQLVTSSPSLVLNRVVVVTSFDSGPLRLGSEPDQDRGWISDGNLAASPPITDPGSIPTAEWDEWYVFDAEQRASMSLAKGLEVFVNYTDFSPDLDRPRPSDVDEETFGYSIDRTERFWNQLTRLQPESFLAEGSLLICVTMNARGFEEAMNYAKTLFSPAG